jgi:hypothetical protein
LIYFIPENNVYAYFRELGNQCVMVVFNNQNSDQREISTKRFVEVLSKYNSGQNIITGEKLLNLNTISLPAKSVVIIELSKQ